MPGRLRRAGARWAVAALTMLLAPPAASGDPALCGALAAPRALQDDGGSGQDAGDERAWAVALRTDGYVWGSLEPPGQYGAADLSDWYFAHVPPGERRVTVGAFMYDHSLGTAALSEALSGTPLAFRLEVWEPGAAEPRHWLANGTNLTLPSTTGGTWYILIYIPPLAGQALCASAPPPPGSGVMRRETQAYGMYFGCDPICFKPQA